MTTIDNMRVQQVCELSRAWRFLSKLNVLPIPVFPVACLLISTCLAAVCIILLGRGVKSWVDDVTGIESKGLGSLMVAYAIEGFVFALSSGLRVYSANVIGDGIGAKLRVALYNNILSQPLRYF